MIIIFLVNLLNGLKPINLSGTELQKFEMSGPSSLGSLLSTSFYLLCTEQETTVIGSQCHADYLHHSILFDGGQFQRVFAFRGF